MIWQVFEICINIYQGFLMIYFFKKHFEQQNPRWWVDCLFIVGIGIVLSVMEFVNTNIPDNLIFIIPFVYSLISTQEKWYSSLLWSLILCCLFICGVTITGEVFSFVWNLSWNDLMQYTNTRIIFVISDNILLTVLVFIIGGIRRVNHAISKRAIFCFLALIMIQLSVNELLYVMQAEQNGQPSLLTYSSIGMLISVIFTVLLFEIMSSLAAQKRQSELALQTVQLLHSHQDELRSVYSNMLATQHDLRHRITIAEQILSSQGEHAQQEAVALLKDTKVLNEFITGNISMDAILTAKSAIMKQAGIAFSFSPYPIQELPIAEEQFCILMSNLLDNAIEGVMRLPAGASSREIQLSFSRSWNMFLISCKNDIDVSTINQKNGQFISSKPHGEIHGFGTQSIRTIVEEADGWVFFNVQQQMFDVEIMLPMEG